MDSNNIIVIDTNEHLWLIMSELETRKVTPYKDKSWYTKWVSSFILLIGMSLTSANIQPINLFFHLIGVIGWGLVGFWWHDRALLFINIIAATIFFTGIINYYV